MTPTPEMGAMEGSATRDSWQRPPLGEEIVISGVSGKFPMSDNVPHFLDNLNNKVNMVTTDDSRWSMDHPLMSRSIGKVQGLDKFDAQFFMVHYKQAWTMDPVARMLLECAYGAIYDAGVNPRTLKSRKIGVFIGSSFAESEKVYFYEKIQVNGFGLTGCAKTMYANRISYWLGATGPSYTIDGGSSSTALALEHAYRALRTGQCEAAIVGGGNAFFHPQTVLQFHRLGFISSGDKTRVFDKNSDGHTGADAAGIVLLQKAKDANRVYCQVYHAMTDVRGGLEPNPVKRPSQTIANFLNDFYSLTGVPPQMVQYVEAYGCGVPDMDKEELEALGTVFCKDRINPLLVGAVASNMGFSYPGSGIAGLTKLLGAYNTRKLPGNLHLEEPHDVEALKDGRMKILTDSVEFSGGYTALNSFSYTGINVHILLKEFGSKYETLPKHEMPWLVTASGRTDSSVETLFKKLLAQTIDPRQIRLLHNIHEDDIPGHMARGYLLMNEKVTEEGSTNESVMLSREYYSGDKRPVWFVYSGMGSQWPAMATHLMAIPIFRDAIIRCHEILKPKGLDLIRIVTEPDPKIFDNILNSFVGIAAVQIGLTDLLWSLGIQPDNIIGHSVGELGCAYADGCLTSEEMILSAYSRGLVSVQTPFIFGSMAAVGIGHKQVEGLKPPEIEVACHNGPDSCTISGPAEDMKKFVADLTAQGIFAKEVPCSNIAYHSRYIAEAGPGLLMYLKQVIPSPRERSSRWVSTSVPQQRWHEPDARLSSAEYHTNNLLSPVLFEETSRIIPANAITIEIAPHGLLQAILRRSLNEKCTNIALTKRGHKNNVEFFLNAIGQLYQVGLTPKLSNIYPRIPLPVPAQTKTLSQLVELEHSEDWFVMFYKANHKVNSGERNFSMSLCDEGYEYMSGCVIDDKNIFPEAAQLVLVWETLGMIVGAHYTQLSVVFSNVRFETEVEIKKNSTLDMDVMIQRGCGKFELIVSGSKVCSGQINIMMSSNIKMRELNEIISESVTLNNYDIYQMFKSKGFGYSGEFQSINQMDLNFETAKVAWRNNWVTFLDSMIQLNHLSQNYDDITRVRSINNIAINMRKHNKQLVNGQDISIERHNLYGITRSAGVEIKDILTVKELKEKIPTTLLHIQKFVPFVKNTFEKVTEALQATIELALENATEKEFKILDLTMKDSLLDILETLPMTHTDMKFERTTKDNIFMEPKMIQNADLMIIPQGYSDKNLLIMLGKILKAGAFIIFVENNETKGKMWPNFDMIASAEVSSLKIILIRKLTVEPSSHAIIQVPANKSWDSVEVEVDNVINCGQKVVLVSENTDALGKLVQWRHEKNGKLSLVVVDDQTRQGFSLTEPANVSQMEKGLAVNVLKNGVWGSYRKIWTSPQYAVPEHVELTVACPGDLSSLIWTEAPPTEGELLVQVNYAQVTSYDVKKMIDITDEDNRLGLGLGMAFSGRTFNGERAMGIGCGGALRSVARAHPDLVWPVPAHWTLEDAATVPQPYLFAYYILALRGTLKKGFRVLVHDGLSPLGQAALNICLAADLEVFTTVSDLRKKHFLLKLFPKLKGSNVCSCQDDSFELVIKTVTEGQGCNLVLNTLYGSLRAASMRCVGFFGILVDVNVENMERDAEFGMNFVSFDKEYTAASFTSILADTAKDAKFRKILRDLVRTGISNGTVRPISRVVFEPQDISRACRMIAAGKQRAAILINITPSSATHRLAVTPALTMPPTQTCMLISMDHDSTLALELLDRMVQAGARNIIMNSPTPMSKEFMAVKMREWNDIGISVEQSSLELSSLEQCRQLLVLARKPLDNLIVAGLEADTATATTLMDNLHQASTTICPQIQHFVFVGREGATHDICEKRLRQGLAAFTLELTNTRTQTNEEKTCVLPTRKERTAILNTLEALLTTGSRGHYTCTLAEDVAGANYFLEKIEKIIGSEVLKHDNDALTLEELSVTEKMAQQVEALLKKIYKTTVPYRRLLMKTLKEFRELLETVSKKQQRPRGLRVFLTQLAQDDYRASEAYILMQTMTSDGTETEDTFVRNEDYVIVVPGLEGHHLGMLELCKRLKLRAFVHQLPIEHYDEELDLIAQRMLKPIKMRLRPGARFHLVGYSFGAGVALTIARMLEELGHEGKVFCIDGTPTMFKSLVKSELGDLCEDEDKLKTAVEELVAEEMRHPSKCHLPNDYRFNSINAVSARLKAALKPWKWSGQLRSQIILVRASESVKNLGLSHDYDLQAITQAPIKIYDLDADHNSCLNDPRLCDIINRELDSNIRELFNKKNLCERYYLAAMDT